MATRYADLKFRVTGGDKLQREIKAVNAELQKIKNQTAQSKAEFAGMANTEAALTASSKLLQDQLNALNKRLELQTQYLKGAQDGLEHTKQAKAGVIKEIQDTIKAYGEEQKLHPQNKARLEELRLKLNELRSEHRYLEKAIIAGNTSIQSAEARIAKTNEEIAKTKTELAQTKKYLDEAKHSFNGTASSIDEFGNKISKSGDAVDALAIAIVASGVKQGLQEIKQAIIDCVNASAEFDAALTGVAKTTSMTGPTLDAFGETLKEMSTRIPMSAASLAEIAAMAGQLGIADENIKSFTETIAALSVSTNIVGSEGAENLARFMNIMGTSQTDVDRLGAAIVDLGNNFATTEEEILAMAMNLAGAGRQAGLTEADVLGIATAISSVGIAAGKGGTAFSKALINMQLAVATGSEKLDDFAAIAGRSREEFAQLFNEDTTEAVKEFFVGLGNGSKPAIELLTEMGVSEVRLRDTMLRLSNATDLFTGAIDRSNEAYDANIALIHEANLFYGTTQSQTEMLKNAFDNLKIAVGDALNPALNELKKTATDVLKVATNFVKNNPGLVKSIVTVVAAASTFVATIMAGTAAVKAYTAVQTALNVVLNSNPFMAVATALAVLVGVIATCALKTDSLREQVDAVNTSFNEVVEVANKTTTAYNEYLAKMEATRDVAEGYISILENLGQQTSMTEAEQQLYNDSVTKLKDLYPELKIEIDETTGLIKGGTEALREQITEWERSARQAAYAEYIKQMTQGVVEAEIELRKTQIARREAEEQLQTTSQQRAEAEQAVIDALGVEATSISDLSAKYPGLLEQQLAINTELKDLYDNYTNLVTSEGNQKRTLEILETAEKEQQEALQDLKDELDTTKKAVSEVADEYVKSADKVASTNTYQLGYDAASGAIRGVRARIDDYATAWSDMALAGQRKFRSVDMIASPSKVYKQLAEYDVEGLIEGTKTSKQRLEDAYANLALRGETAFTNAAQTINNNSSATFTVNTTSLSPDMVDYLFGEFNRRLNRV